MKKTSLFISRLVKAFFVLIITYLLLLTSLTNSYFGYLNDEHDGIPHYFYYKDNTIIIIPIFLIILFLLSKVQNSNCFMNVDEMLYKIEKNRKIIYIAYFILSAVLIFTLKIEPVSDPKKCMDVAKQLLEGNYSAYAEKEGYMFRCPHQNGLVLFDYTLLLMFGENAFLAFHLINSFFSVLMIEILGNISKIIFENEKNIAIYVRLTLIVFPVWLFNVPYNYGIVISTTLIFLAIYFELLFLNDNRIRYIVMSSVAAGVGVLFKLNAMIFIIGMILVLLWDCIKYNRVKKNIAFIIALILCRLVIVRGADIVMENITGIITPHGLPALNYVAMGIDYGSNGTFNGKTVDIYRSSGWNVEKSNLLAKEDIDNSIKHFISNKDYSISWLGRKLGIEWTNPTFSSLRLISRKNGYAFFSLFYRNLIEQDVNGWLVKYLNVFESLIIFGASYWVISYSSMEQRITELLLPICMMGGFIFHVIWEAAANYVLPYFISLFPFAVYGVIRLVYDLKNSPKKVIAYAVFLVIVLVACSIAFDGKLINLIRVYDEEDYLSRYSYY